jgi:hypothetical protein
MKDDDWYRRATGNKAQHGVTFTVRMGSDWLRIRDVYIAAVQAQETLLAQANNYRASRVLRYHRRALPMHLPYELTVTGYEWPLLASALLASGNPKVQTLYRRFQRAKKETDDARNGRDEAAATNEAVGVGADVRNVGGMAAQREPA